MAINFESGNIDENPEKIPDIYLFESVKEMQDWDEKYIPVDAYCVNFENTILVDGNAPTWDKNDLENIFYDEGEVEPLCRLIKLPVGYFIDDSFSKYKPTNSIEEKIHQSTVPDWPSRKKDFLPIEACAWAGNESDLDAISEIIYTQYGKEIEDNHLFKLAGQKREENSQPGPSTKTRSSLTAVIWNYGPSNIELNFN